MSTFLWTEILNVDFNVETFYDVNQDMNIVTLKKGPDSKCRQSMITRDAV